MDFFLLIFSFFEWYLRVLIKNVNSVQLWHVDFIVGNFWSINTELSHGGSVAINLEQSMTINNRW